MCLISRCCSWRPGRRNKDSNGHIPSRAPSPTVPTLSPSQPPTETHPVLSPGSQPITDAIPRAQTVPGQHDGQRPGEPSPPPSSPKVTTSAAERDLWSEALNKLGKDVRQKLQMDNSESKSVRQQVGDLVDVAKTKQDECEEKSWKFKVGDREIILRDYAANIVSCLTQIGNIAIQFAPPQASLPWSVIKAVMQIPVKEVEQMYALLASTEQIVRIVKRGQVYESVYKPENTPGSALEILHVALVNLYRGTLELLADSLELSSKDKAAQIVYAILHPNQTVNLVSKLDYLENKLSHEVQACQSVWSSAADQRLTKLLDSLDIPLTRVDERVSALLEHVEETKHVELLQWISPIPHGEIHNGLPPKTSGTCEWLLRNDRFREWERTSSSVILWLHGSPGTGKTCLTSKVIDHVQETLRKTPNHEGFAFFYCDQTDPVRRQPLSVLRSFVRQLSTIPSNPQQMLVKLRQLCNNMRIQGSHLMFDDCKRLILDSVNLYPKTTLVLDALDECEPNSREKLVQAMEDLLSKSERPLKIFISSRPDRDIRMLFISRPNIEIQTTDNQGDIEKFLDEKVKKESWSEPLIREIKDKLLDGSKGMFQWVHLQVNQILSCESESAVRNTLGKLPEGLEEAYNEIYDKIAKRDKNDKALADHAFMWVMCACTPLSSKELLSAIRVYPDPDVTDLADKITESSLLALCNNLLVLDSERKVWRFSHLSVAEYFEKSDLRHHLRLVQSHCNAAKVCLKLLIETYKLQDESEAEHHGDKDESEPQDILSLAHPFQMYLRHHWVIHVRSYEKQIADGQKADPMLTRLLETFLGSPGESSAEYRGWHHQIVLDGYYKPSSSIFNEVDNDEISPGTVTTFAMCRFSFYSVLRNWWTIPEKIDFSQTNKRNENLLTLAAVAGCKSICQILIEGAQPDLVLSTGDYGSALIAAAAARGNIEIVKFLIEKGAQPDISRLNGGYGSALAAASARGNIEIVKFLIEEEAQPDLLPSSGEYGSALAAAACGGNFEIVKFLIEKRAQPDLVLLTGDYGSALAAAAAAAALKGEDIEIVKFLIEKGAQPDLLLSSGNYGSALAAAAAGRFLGGNIKIVKFLIEKGAQPDLVLSAGKYGSALTAAAAATSLKGEDIEIVKFLIEKGAQPDLLLLTGYYGSALAAAATRANIEIVKFLIEKGAQPDLVLSSGNYGSALAAAAAGRFLGGNIKIVKFLIEKGAQPDLVLSAGKYGSALAAAGGGGGGGGGGNRRNIEIIKFLIEKGAQPDLSLSTGDYGSALAAAAAEGKIKIVKFLIEKGAQPDLLLSIGYYGSALTAAAAEGNIEIVKFLIEKGAQPDLVLLTGDYGSALAAAAAAEGNIEIVKFLIEKGAQPDLSLSTGDYGSALAAAAAEGKIEIVKFLIEKGAQPDLLLSTGYYGSALTAAAAEGNIEIVKFLIEKGAQPDLLLSTGDYSSALAAAAEEGEIEIVKFLIEKGAQPDLVLSTGNYGSALVAAAYFGRKECVESLLEAGAQANKTLENGRFRSALQASQADVSEEDRMHLEWNHIERIQEAKPEVAELLKRHGATNED